MRCRFLRFVIGIWRLFEGPGGFLIEFPQHFIKIRPKEAQKVPKMLFPEVFWNLLHPVAKSAKRAVETYKGTQDQLLYWVDCRTISIQPRELTATKRWQDWFRHVLDIDVRFQTSESSSRGETLHVMWIWSQHHWILLPMDKNRIDYLRGKKWYPHYVFFTSVRRAMKVHLSARKQPVTNGKTSEDAHAHAHTCL